MIELIKAKVGMAGIILGIMGAMAGVGAIEAAVTLTEIVVGSGIASVSLMIMYVGVELIKAAE